ncbi:MAG TPA: glycosyltransferase [Actinocrinis sp.]|uniref:glycosyltransferase n=1 Tax=Actinocrinis sp. TaxID=1920516 RepID=UPI002DDCB7C0|nr:glycosyltransferase [Actinocrinis sp.]HEV2344633.1 glycosyltransferase [Actinocrinis sp.]
MRIVQLANMYHARSGGLRTVVDTLGRGYIAAGHERFLIVPGAKPSIAADERNGTVITVPGTPVSGGYRMIFRPERVLRILASLAPDSVEVSDKATLVVAGPWARERGVRAVLFSHERLDSMVANRTGIRTLPRSMERAVGRWSRKVVAGFDDHVATSAYGERELTEAGATAIRRVPLGVDLNVFRPHPRALPAPPPGLTTLPRIKGAEAGPGLAPTPAAGPIRLVYSGRLSTEKNPHTAVEALRALRQWGIDATLDVYGSGPQFASLTRRADGLPVTFHGHIADRARLAAKLSHADLVLAPAACETFGLSVLEALACGVAVVAAAGSGAAELVSPEPGGAMPGAGLAVEASADGIALGVIELLAHPARERATAARARATQFPWSASVGRMLAIHSGEGHRCDDLVSALGGVASPAAVEAGPVPVEDHRKIDINI